MPSTYSSLKFELIATGEQAGTWGNTTNINIGTAIEEAITGSATVTFTSGANTAIALTNTNAAQAARNLRLDLSGTMTTSQYLYVPAIEKFYIINNTLSNTVIVSNGSNAAATGTAVSIPSSTSVMLFNDGVNVTSVISHIPSLANVTITSGNATLTNLTATTGNITTGNISTLTVTTTATIAGASITSGNATLTNLTATTGNVTTGNIASLTVTSNASIAGASVTSGNATLTNLTATTANLTNANVTSVLTVAAGTNAAPSITTSGDTNTGIFFPAADTVAIGTGGTEALRVNSSQNVGIGTSSPAVTLHAANTSGGGVSGANPSGEVSRIQQTPSFGSGGFVAQRLFLNKTSTANDGVTQSFEGLAVGGDRYALANIGGYIDNAGSGNSVSGYFAILTKPTNASITERARITSGGHFCVGTTTVANTAFQATFFESSNGGIILQNSTNYSAVSCSGNDVYIDVGRGGTAGSFNVRTSSNNDVRLQISSTGVMTCLGVYNNTVGATNRDVFVDNTGKVGYVASIRASKTNIQDLTDTSWLHQLNPVSFNYRKKDEEGGYTDETDGDIQYGMIAEDVEQVRPDLCFYDEVDGEQELRGIQYSKLVPVMLKEIQKLRAELDALKGNA